MTLGEILRRSTAYLEEKGVESPRLDAELLLGKALGLTRIQVYTDFERPLTEAELAACRELLGRRGAREPLAYVLGEWGFRRLTLRTDRRALVPRPETEVLVERCLALVRDLPEPRVLDVGVGTGAIALAVLDEHPGARVTGVDTSAEALSLARENADRLGLAVELRAAGVEVAGEGWDLVVANPPYVDPADLPGLQAEVRDWEPRAALVGNDMHRRIAAAARTTWLAFEVGDGQAAAVASLLAELGYDDVRMTADLAGRNRVVEGRRP